MFFLYLVLSDAGLVALVLYLLRARAKGSRLSRSCPSSCCRLSSIDCCSSITWTKHCISQHHVWKLWQKCMYWVNDAAIKSFSNSILILKLVHQVHKSRHQTTWSIVLMKTLILIRCCLTPLNFESLWNLIPNKSACSTQHSQTNLPCYKL